MKQWPVFDIQRGSMVDGPGLRTAFFFKGCNLRCAWCHNPESQSAEPELMYYSSKCTGCGACKRICPNEMKSCTLCGRCAKVCPTGARRLCGGEYTVEELAAIAEKDRDYYECSGGGVTCSGGECLLYPDAVAELFGTLKARGISTAVDTAGHVAWESFEKVLPVTELFLYDLKAMDSDTHRRYTGVGNERILENLQKLFEAGARVWIRVPVIGGVNDTSKNMEALRDFLRPYHPEKIELLAYHKMGEGKYPALGRACETFPIPAKEKLDALYKIVTE